MSPLMACRAAHGVGAAVFSPDGRTLAVFSSSFGDTLELFEVQTGARLWKHSGLGCLLLGVQFSRDGRLLAIGENVRRATVLAAEDGRVIRREDLASDTQAFTFASITPDGARLALATATVLRVHDISSGAQMLEMHLGASWCHGIQFSPDATQLATAADHGVQVWDATTGEARHVFGTSAPVRALRFSRCGHMLTAADRNNTVRGWDIRSGVETNHPFPASDTRAVSLSPDGLLALAMGRDGTLRFWDLTTRGRCASSVHLGGRRPVAALSHDRQQFAVGTGREVKVWDAKAGNLQTTAVQRPGGCRWCGLENHDRRSGAQAAGQAQPTQPPPVALTKTTPAVRDPALLPVLSARDEHDVTAGEPMTRLDRSRSVVRAVAFGACGSLLSAAACAAVVVLTGGYSTGMFVGLGLIVAIAVGLARPAIRPLWIQALSLASTMLGLLLAEYAIARHLDGPTDAPLLLPLHDTVKLVHDDLAGNVMMLVFSGLALVAASRAPAYVERALSERSASAQDSPAPSRALRQWITGHGAWPTATAAGLTGLVALVLLTGARLGPAERSQTPDAASHSTARVPSTTAVSFARVRAGDCYNNPPGNWLDTLPELPCRKPHDGEVFYVFAMPVGKYPGDKAVDVSAEQTCWDRFARIGYRLSGPLDFEYFTPARLAWNAGDRAIQCALVRDDGHKLDRHLPIR